MNDPSQDQPIVVYVTTPSPEVGKEIAAMLLDQKLAACVNIVSPVTSLYLWQGEKHEDQETLLIVKSRLGLFADRLVPAVLQIHPYETPEIIAMPVIAGQREYLEWIEHETRGSDGAG
jgi:periplasmic divalent cation tolerance protein